MCWIKTEIHRRILIEKIREENQFNQKIWFQHFPPWLDGSLLSSLLFRLGGLFEQLEIDLTGIDIDFQMNRKFYDSFNGSMFLFSQFIDGMFKLRWITGSLLPDSSKEKWIEKIKKLVFGQRLLLEYEVQVMAPLDFCSAGIHRGTETTWSPIISAGRRESLFAKIENELKKCQEDERDQYSQLH